MLTSRVVLKTLTASLCLAAFLSGCSKKEAAVSAPETPVAPVAEAPASAPTPAVSAASAAAMTRALADADAALKAKEYEKAVQAVLALRQQRLSEQQAQAAHNQMIQIQSALGAALQSGDPRAKAAVEMIRQSTMQ